MRWMLIKRLIFLSLLFYVERSSTEELANNGQLNQTQKEDLQKIGVVKVDSHFHE